MSTILSCISARLTPLFSDAWNSSTKTKVVVTASVVIATLVLSREISRRFFSHKKTVAVKPTEQKIAITPVPPVVVKQTKKTEAVAKKHAEQLVEFEKWAAAKNWEKFHYAHYDWWAFPINRASLGCGTEYQVSPEDIALLKADAVFMKNYRRTVHLVMLAWGWDLEKKGEVPRKERNKDQTWSGYGVRLGKMADSLYQFGEADLFRKVTLFYEAHKKDYTLEAWIAPIFARTL